MNCKKCGNQLSADSLFCPYCGEKVQSGTSEAPGDSTAFLAQEDTGAAPVESPNADAQAVPGESASGPQTSGADEPKDAIGPAGTESTEAGTTQQTSDAPSDSAAEMPAPDSGVPEYCPRCHAKSEPGSKFCGRCGAALSEMPAPQKPQKSKKKWLWIVAAVAAAVCAAVGIFFGVSALKGKGASQTLTNALRNTLSAPSVTAELSIYSDGSLDNFYHIEAELDLKHKDVTALIRNYDGDTVALYNGYLMERYGSFVYKQDISDELMEAFDSYNTYSDGNVDVDSMLEDMDPWLRTEAEEVLDFDVASDCVQELKKCLNDKDWLEENAGYNVVKNGSETTYYVSISTRTVAAVLEIFKPAFRSQGSYYDLKEELVDEVGGLACSYTTDGKYLTRITVDVVTDYSTNSVVIDFSNIGSTRVDVDQLTYWLSIAED